MIKPSCLIKVPSSADDGTFFQWWMRFLTPFHALTGREMDVAAALFQRRYELSKSVSDPILLDKLVVNSDSQAVVEKQLGLTHNYMKVILTKLRKCNVILEDRLNPKFIPNVTPDNSTEMFSVLLVFDFKADAKKKKQEAR